MYLYENVYWYEIKKELYTVFPKNIVDFLIISKIYVCLERLRFDIYIYMKKYIHKPIKSSKYTHPLILLGTLPERTNWSKNIDKMLTYMDYNKLIKIKSSRYMFHYLHYYYWKIHNFCSTYYHKRYKINNKNLWNMVEIEDIPKNKNITIIISNNNKYSLINGYVSFDDKPFEGKRRFIGLSKNTKSSTIECKEKIEIFDVSKIHTIYIKKSIYDNFITEINNLFYKFNLKYDVDPWLIKNNTLISMTYYDNNKRIIENFRFIKKINNTDFTKWLVINKYNNEEVINLYDYCYPKFYKIKDNTKCYSDDFIYVECTSLPEPFDCSAEIQFTYDIQFRNNTIMKENIPRFINSTLLGFLGRFFIIENNKISIVSFLNDKTSDFIKRLSKILINCNIKIIKNTSTHITIILHNII